MSSCVLDASAALAVLRSEPGASVVISRKAGALISAVNFAEVMSRMIQLGMESDEAQQAAGFLTRNVIAFDHHHAYIAAQLLPHTSRFGLGIGDRACLALAIERKLPVLTADKAWKALRIGVEIRVIR